MKLKDIKVGERYALATLGDRNNRRNWVEAEVLEVGLKKRVYTGARWDFGGHMSSAALFVRVRYEQYGKAREELVHCTKIVLPWAEAKEAIAETLRAAEERQQRQDKARAEAAAAVERLHVLGAGSARMTKPGQIAISASDMARVLDGGARGEG